MENPVMPIWIAFPDLPIHLHDKRALHLISSSIGTPLKVDFNTLNFSRPGLARCCVEVDISNLPPAKVLINHGGEELIFPFYYENVPLFCKTCKGTGHTIETCAHRKIPPEKDNHKREAFSKKGARDNQVQAKEDKIAEQWQQVVSKKGKDKLPVNGAGKLEWRAKHAPIIPAWNEGPDPDKTDNSMAIVPFEGFSLPEDDVPDVSFFKEPEDIDDQLKQLDALLSREDFPHLKDSISQSPKDFSSRTKDVKDAEIRAEQAEEKLEQEDSQINLLEFKLATTLLQQALKKEESFWAQKANISPPVGHLLMGNLRATHFSVLVNGQPQSFFPMKCGVKQGDPLSHLLFIIALEGLSRFLNHQFSRGYILPFSAGRNPTPCHLLYADDIILFTKADSTNLLRLRELLSLFMKASGKEINYSKSQVIVHERMKAEQQNQIRKILSIRCHTKEFTYLGSNIVKGKLRKVHCKVEKFEKKINAWYSKKLNMMGRLILIKHVLSSIPLHLMAAQRIPKSILKSLNRLMANYFWGINEEGPKYHWRKWEKLSFPFEEGGLGLRNILNSQNAAYIDLWWKVITGNSIWGKFMKSKYFRDGIFSPKIYDSYTWKAICKISPLVLPHCSYHGEDVAWLSGTYSFKIAYSLTFEHKPRMFTSVYYNDDKVTNSIEMIFMDEHVIIYLIKLSVKDDSRTTTFVLFDCEASNILNISCAELMEKSDLAGSFENPKEFDDLLLGKTYIFKVETDKTIGYSTDGKTNTEVFLVGKPCVKNLIVDFVESQDSHLTQPRDDVINLTPMKRMQEELNNVRDGDDSVNKTRSVKIEKN
ncbi:unnamed protein product [Cuscuta campestris]|uniref:Reverse transcriptase domain-containing protein n=1 Tax=Cuscuta campestris TaxID=132261 RepID=A0A484KXL4_9ASTE|nr:unnamed protein product [Cuscuta campestris]